MLETLDVILISLYRITGNPVADYFIGTFLLAVLSVMVGQVTVALVYRVNRRHLEKLDRRAVELNRLSSKALEIGDEKSYKACNKEANESFGHSFFGKFGLSAASFWPAFFALAWMQERFSDVGIPLPMTSLEVNYFVVFLVLYIGARVLFSRVKKALGHLKSTEQGVAEKAGG
jgi:hypothetical protein